MVERSTVCRLALAALASVALACGSSTPTQPTSPAPIPAAQACDLLGSIGAGGGSAIGILSGAECSPRGPVVKLNMRQDISSAGSCTGTLITPRAILTAAHCLDGGHDQIRVWFGEGPEYIAASSVYHPQFSSSSLQLDIGLVLMDEDMPRAPAAILTSRTARVGETALLAGFGRDENSDTTRLRAGSTAISGVTAMRLETRYAPPASSICQGDSGGPLFVSEGGVWAIAGISSATTQSACNTGTNYYQAVLHSSALSFIEQHVQGFARR